MSTDPGQVDARALRQRIVMLGTELGDDVVTALVAQLLFLEREDAASDISLYVNSAGGSMTAGLALIDTMRAVKPDVATVCIGHAAGLAALVLACGARGKRSATENARIMLVPPHATVDSAEQLREVQRLHQEMVRLLADATGQKSEQVAADLEARRAFSAAEARDYGLIDTVTAKPRG
ncbi:MAG: ATP-dependent Clp protease proteolytic subunit [Archangiaceae bacterium]|nr:ATP-dependent Clp protease proteolytic subunit [Archangiaceae bacterium]